MKRIPSLDGLRAISIVLVMLSHLIKWKHVSVPVLEAYGALGVHVFFVLSGFLITDLLLRERERTSSIDLPNFYLRRAFRIFPAAFVFLAVVTVLYWPEMHWTHVAAAVFYVANMDLSRPWIFGHLWSLSIEEQFYLLWPLALKRWHRYRIAILICVFVGTPVFRAILYAVKAHGPIVASLPVVADQLAIGCLLAIFAKRLPRIPGYLAFFMTAAAILLPWYPATSAARSLLMLFVLRPPAACLNCGRRSSRHSSSVCRSELETCSLVGQDQLQPLSVARAVLLKPKFALWLRASPARHCLRVPVVLLC